MRCLLLLFQRLVVPALKATVLVFLLILKQVIKKSLRCNAIVPKVSIVDPAVMGTMPPHVLASVGFDALCHNIEAYTSKTSQPFTDALAHYAVTLLAQYLVPLYKHVKATAEGKSAVLNVKFRLQKLGSPLH